MHTHLLKQILTKKNGYSRIQAKAQIPLAKQLVNW